MTTTKEQPQQETVTHQLDEGRTDHDQTRSRIETVFAELEGSMVKSPAKETPGLQEDQTQAKPTAPQPAQEEIVSPELEQLRSDLAKTQKRLTENQQYGRQNAQRLKNALRITQDLVAEGSLSEDEALRLRDSLEHDSQEDLSFQEKSDRASHPFSRFFKVANIELENIRKYTGDTLLDEKIKAFDYYLSTASLEEREQLLEEFEDLKDQPLELTRKMLTLGQKVYEESYRDIQEAGGFKGYIAKKQAEITTLTKTVEKLTKKLLQYEDYDMPKYGLAEMGSSQERKPAGLDSVDQVFALRDRPAVRPR